LGALGAARRIGGGYDSEQVAVAGERAGLLVHSLSIHSGGYSDGVRIDHLDADHVVRAADDGMKMAIGRDDESGVATGTVVLALMDKKRFDPFPEFALSNGGAPRASEWGLRKASRGSTQQNKRTKHTHSIPLQIFHLEPPERGNGIPALRAVHPPYKVSTTVGPARLWR
jgi:hypothetical protein